MDFDAYKQSIEDKNFLRVMYVEFVLELLQLGRKCLYYGRKKAINQINFFSETLGY